MSNLRLRAGKRLDIPVMFNQDDLSYVLHSNSYVLQRHYELPEPDSGGTFLAETTVNSDSGQSSVTGKVNSPFFFRHNN